VFVLIRKKLFCENVIAFLHDNSRQTTNVVMCIRLVLFYVIAVTWNVVILHDTSWNTRMTHTFIGWQFSK